MIDKYDPKVHSNYDVTELKKKMRGKKMKEKDGDGEMSTLRKSTG